MKSSSGSTPKIETESGGRLEGLSIIGEVEAELAVGRMTFEAPALVVLGDPDGRARFGGGGVNCPSLALSESVPGDDMVDGQRQPRFTRTQLSASS